MERKKIVENFLKKTNISLAFYEIKTYEDYLWLGFLSSFFVSLLFYFLLFELTESLLIFLFGVFISYAVPYLYNLSQINRINSELPIFAYAFASFSNRLSFIEVVKSLSGSETLLSKLFSKLVKLYDDGMNFSNALDISFSELPGERVTRFKDYLKIAYLKGSAEEVLKVVAVQFEREYLQDVKKYSTFYALYVLFFLGIGILYPVFSSIMSIYTGKVEFKDTIIISFFFLIVGLTIAYVAPLTNRGDFFGQVLFGLMLFLVISLSSYTGIAVPMLFSLIIICAGLYFLYTKKESISYADVSSSYFHLALLERIVAFEDILAELSKKQYGKISAYFQEILSEVRTFGVYQGLRRIKNRFKKNLFVGEIADSLILIYSVGKDFRENLLVTARYLEKLDELRREREGLLLLPKMSLGIAILIIPFISAVVTSIYVNTSISEKNSFDGLNHLHIGLLLVSTTAAILLSILTDRTSSHGIILIGTGAYFVLYFASLLIFSNFSVLDIFF